MISLRDFLDLKDNMGGKISVVEGFIHRFNCFRNTIIIIITIVIIAY